MKNAKGKWLNEILSTELPEPYSSLADIIGLDNTILLAGKMGGSTLYLPKIDTLYRGVRDKKIRKEFTGGNYNSLAKKYGLTERRIRKIVNDLIGKRIKKEKGIITGEQLKLF